MSFTGPSGGDESLRLFTGVESPDSLGGELVEGSDWASPCRAALLAEKCIVRFHHASRSKVALDGDPMVVATDSDRVEVEGPRETAEVWKLVLLASSPRAARA